MKRLLSTLWMTLFLLSVHITAAYADVLIPGQEHVREKTSSLPFILVGAALIVIGVIIWRIRKKK